MFMTRKKLNLKLSVTSLLCSKKIAKKRPTFSEFDFKKKYALQAELLTFPFSDFEINVVDSCNPSKAPGPDSIQL